MFARREQTSQRRHAPVDFGMDRVWFGQGRGLPPYAADTLSPGRAENLSDTPGRIRLRKLVKKFEGDCRK